MVRLLIEDGLRIKLDEIRVPTELCDKQGRVIGVFTPTADPDRKWYEWAKGRYSDEELERRYNEPGEKTTAEVLKSLHET
jgi:hypothetical protein